MKRVIIIAANKKKLIIVTSLIILIVCVSCIIFDGDYAAVEVIDKTSQKFVLDPDIEMFPKITLQGQPGTGGTGSYLYKPAVPIPAIVNVNATGYKKQKRLIFLMKGKTNTIYLEPNNSNINYDSISQIVESDIPKIFNPIVPKGLSALKYVGRKIDDVLPGFIEEMQKSGWKEEKDKRIGLVCFFTKKVNGNKVEITAFPEERELGNGTTVKIVFAFTNKVSVPDRLIDRTDMDAVISEYILLRSSRCFYRKLKWFEVHNTFGVEDRNGKKYAYLYVHRRGFSFDEDRFRLFSGGSGAVVMVLKQKEDGEFYVLDYITPMPGEGIIESIKQMFPPQYVLKVQERMRSNDMGMGIEKQVKEWLKEQGRDEDSYELHP
ncbi:hypothetical protein [Pseudobacteroides cellulosolvens]|uniref:Uncharacterized protein n=1 Tax=Pseudobacteroides cellulosolvens ATCC 35603 = DSM 2933 TaxID=398512 RepID=A0A0L6JPQ7_9FIRM|nr:hypothetical protein [Pseudobacteroides cellulosolvens]KNY27362.1 hypothetical protein Bccel_2633 [Pseudobacteroides cellulosolvens ATCC 35603 = DSM 2933]